MNKNQLPLKIIQVDKLFDVSLTKVTPKSLTKSTNSEFNQSKRRVVTTQTIKQLNARVSRKAYNSLNSWNFHKTNSKRVISCFGCHTLQNYERTSQELHSNVLNLDSDDLEDQKGIIYKLFPKRQAFVKNNKTMKFFNYLPKKLPNFMKFMTEDCSLDIKLSQDLSFCKVISMNELGQGRKRLKKGSQRFSKFKGFGKKKAPNLLAKPNCSLKSDLIRKKSFLKVNRTQNLTPWEAQRHEY